MDILSLLNHLEKNQIFVSLDGNDLEVNFMQDEVPADIIRLLKENKATLVHYLKKLQGVEDFEEIPRIEEQVSYPLSSSQMRLWVLSQFDDASIAYNLPFTLDLDGDYNLSILEQAIHDVIDRHEILRTVFKQDSNGVVRQWVIPKKKLAFRCRFHNLSALSDARTAAEQMILDDTYKSFDLEKGPLLRVLFIKLSEKKHVFYFNMHHIISDGWSMEVLVRDTLAFYNAYLEKRPAVLPTLNIQYKDFAAWQSSQLELEGYKNHRSYWLEKLSGSLPTLNLPSIKQRPTLKTHNGRHLSFYLSKEDKTAIEAYITAKEGTLFMFLLASLKVLFYRYTSQEDLIVGSPIVGRNHSDLEDQIGFYVNTLVLRTCVTGEMSFDALYQQIKQDLLAAYTHQMYPFDKLVEGLNLPRDTSRSALFDILVVLQNFRVTEGVEKIPIEDMDLIKDNGTTMSKFDVTFIFVDLKDAIKVDLTYNTDVYDNTTITNLIKHFKQLVRNLIVKNSVPIGKQEYLSEREKSQLLIDFNDMGFVYPNDKTIIGLFEEQVSRTPDNVALIFGDVALTYRELNQSANQLARYLRAKYLITSDDLIGVKTGRSEWMIISILGALKSGGAYVPIDPNNPQERIDYLLADSNCKVLIDQEELAIFVKDKAQYSDANLEPVAKINDLAYIIYTSGSTGQPKGVMIEHQSLVNYICYQTNYFGIDETERFVLFSSIAFDASIEQIFLPIVNGASLLIPKLDSLEHKKVIKILADHKVTHLHAVPSFLRTLSFDSSLHLKRIISAGESFDPTMAKLWINEVEIYNKYGPTEATISVTECKITSENIASRSIGNPIGNANCYILNEQNMLQAKGVVGEICVGGIALARGYLNKAELTALKFVPHPFIQGTRIYKTGDLGRWLPDGTIEFIGRKDNQVKVRGYRIELGEIEHTLLLKDEIKTAVVIVKQLPSGDKDLVAYFNASHPIGNTEIRSHLQERLPSYMIPSFFVPLAEFPLTSNGKIDKRALLNQEGLGLAGGSDYVAPSTALEKQLVTIWETVLEREPIGVKESFFELGGHSLKLIKLINSYNKNFNVEIKLRDLFVLTTIEKHADLIGVKGWLDNKENKENKENSYNQIITF